MCFSDEPALPGARSTQELERTSSLAWGTYGRGHVLLISLEGIQPIRYFQQCGCPQLGATGDETPIVLHPKAEECLITHLLEAPDRPRWERREEQSNPSFV